MGGAIIPFDQQAEFIDLPQGDEDAPGSDQDELAPALREVIESALNLSNQAERVVATANAQDAEELRTMLAALGVAITRRNEAEIRSILHEVEDLVFYLQDA
jgi:molecular chaperone DnaK